MYTMVFKSKVEVETKKKLMKNERNEERNGSSIIPNR